MLISNSFNYIQDKLYKLYLKFYSALYNNTNRFGI